MVAVRGGQDCMRRPPRYPRYRPGPTGRHRRRRGWHEVTRIREILKPVQDNAAAKFSDRRRGVRGQEAAVEMTLRDPRRHPGRGSTILYS